MPNKYGLPEKELGVIRARDKVCVYCGKKMVKPQVEISRCDWATIEHMNYLKPWDNPKTVAICCWSCNSSRGQKKLMDWFKTKYCTEREKPINEETVADVVKEYLKKKRQDGGEDKPYL